MSAAALAGALAFGGGASACVVGSPLAEAGPESRVQVLEDRANSMRLRTEGPGGLLVISRLAAAGFAARVSGKEVAGQDVNGALLGIAIPPGEHEVEIRYRPRSVQWGLLVSLLSLVLWFWGIRRGRFADSRPRQ